MSFDLIDTKQYYLSSNSKNITKYNGSYNSHLRVEIPNFIESRQNLQYSTISILTAQIPYSFYIINEYNNKFKFNNHIIELEYGNYNAKTLGDLINAEIQQHDATAKITLNQITGKYEITGNNTFSIDLTLSDLAKVLGGEKGIYNGIFSLFSGFRVALPYLCNTSGSKYLNIKISNLLTENINLSSMDKNTLVSIPINVSPFGIIQYNNIYSVESLVKNDTMDNIELQITDDEGRYINFNNIDWSITIIVKSRVTMSKTKTLDDYFRNNPNLENIDEIIEEE
jgi:hypothetical protein